MVLQFRKERSSGMRCHRCHPSEFCFRECSECRARRLGASRGVLSARDGSVAARFERTSTSSVPVDRAAVFRVKRGLRTPGEGVRRSTERCGVAHAKHDARYLGERNREMACHGDSGGTLVLIAASDTPRGNRAERARGYPARLPRGANPRPVVPRARTPSSTDASGTFFCHANLRSDIPHRKTLRSPPDARRLAGLRHVPLPPRD